MKKLLILAAVALLLPACSHYRNITAGQIGCAPGDIDIKNENDPVFGATTWEAKCEGRRYICTESGNQVSCAEKQG